MTQYAPHRPVHRTEPGQRHQAYAQLARTGPVHRITLPTGTPAWLVTGHDEVPPRC